VRFATRRLFSLSIENENLKQSTQIAILTIKNKNYKKIMIYILQIVFLRKIL